ncbi:MAG: DUF5017 domain-containing protein [Chitinophagaceae bacterium]
MKFRYCFLLLALLVMISCKKTLDVKDAPDFTVTTDANTYKVNDLIRFKIEGSADIISFYSGEVYRDYAFKDGRVVDVSGQKDSLSFNSGVAPGTPAGTQLNQFSILASTDFSGNYNDLTSVKVATWKDITSRFTLGTTATLVKSPTQNITDLVVAGKPIYFSLKYISKPQVANGYARQWLTENFTITSSVRLNDVPVVITDQVHAGFRIVDQNPVNAPARSQVTTTRVTLYGPFYKDPKDPIFDPANPIFDPKNPIYDPASTQYIATAVLPKFVPYDPNSPYNDPLSENWAVSAPISLDKVDLGTDKAVAVRSSVYTVKPTLYTYRYAKPGTYKAVFVATNSTIDESKKIIKEIGFTITP